MSEESNEVKQAVLELGLEDWIPLPEAVTAVEVRAALRGDREAWPAVSEALKDLLREHRVQLFRGRWDEDDPRALSDAEALEVLGEERWYTFHPEDPEDERIYFVNVKNVRRDAV